jgi:CxxC motif-containing protein (DUF1111 family)
MARGDGRDLGGCAGRAMLPVFALTLVFAACRERSLSPPVDAAERAPGGETSISIEPRPSFDKPAANLGTARKPEFYAGRALARQPWVRAPSSTDARDGLGPLYNARSCFGCHTAGGRGAASTTDGPLTLATVVRLSLPTSTNGRGPRPEPTYGRQLQVQSTDLAHQLRLVPGARAQTPSPIPPEAQPQIRWRKRLFRYPDGRVVTLRRPELAIEGWAYGPPDPNTKFALRATPPLHGMGLLERIPQEALLAQADPEDRDGDGISGRPNYVEDPTSGERVLGRFGLKANQSSLLNQVGAALRDDMGITNPVHDEEVCTAAEESCRRAPHGRGPDGHEISAELLDVLLAFVRSIGVPERRMPDHPMVRSGRDAFYAVGCQSCHTPRFETRFDDQQPHLSAQVIWPYTDLLLHDMGDALADGRPDSEASGAEWRTPPLWGVGLARSIGSDVAFLHDGRARTIEEAVLWHGGEAAASRDSFARLSANERAQLLAFVRSL